jgi:hypothetical protein
VIDALLAQLWPLALVMAGIGYWVHVSNRRRYKAQVQRNIANAKAQGMGYTAPAGVDGSGPLRGMHHFEGTTDGIVWKAETLFLTDQETGTYGLTQNNSQNYTRWTGTNAGTGSGALILMNPPAGVTAPKPANDDGGGGFMNALTEKAAQAAFQLFVRITFGTERSARLPLKPQHRVILEADAFGCAFVAFSDRPELLSRLGPPARELLLEEREQRVAFLWDAEGLSLTWPTPYLSPEDIAARAAFGVRLAHAVVR